MKHLTIDELKGRACRSGRKFMEMAFDALQKDGEVKLSKSNMKRAFKMFRTYFKTVSKRSKLKEYTLEAHLYSYLCELFEYVADGSSYIDPVSNMSPSLSNKEFTDTWANIYIDSFFEQLKENRDEDNF